MNSVVDLDGHFQQWSLTGAIAHGTIQRKSDLHLQARSILKECFPTLQILEEVPIPIRRGEILYLDFYLPLNKKCIEVHGEQHYKFVPFFHIDRMGFAKHKKRDHEKKEWCELNNLTYIELPYNLSIEEWKNRILND